MTDHNIKIDKYDEPVFITGAARSGTSLVANLLEASGLWLGDTEHGRPENPSGFFENRRIRDGLIKTLLVSNKADPLGVDPLPIGNLFLDINLHKIIPRLLAADEYMGQQWGYKDAKLVHFWRDFIDCFPLSKWIFVKRNFKEIVASCERARFMNVEDGSRNHAFWETWVEAYLDRMDQLKEELRKRKIKYFEIDVNLLVDGDLNELQDVVEALDLTWDAKRMSSLINPDLWNRDGNLTRLDITMGLNAKNDDILNNIRENITRQLPQAKPFHNNNQQIAIVAGGPSLKYTLDELKQQVKEGVKIVSVNGTHDWLVENGLKPSMHVMVDSRPWNERFVRKPIDTCKYFIASQCHPSVFEALKNNKTYIFHVVNELGEKAILDDYYYGKYHFVVGGSTVTLRTIWLCRMLGFMKMDVYGLDSCYMDGEHHAYSQPENDDCEIRDIMCAGEDFKCAAWMASQFDDFQHFIQTLGDKFELNVHGNGLIAHMMGEGAKLYREQQLATGG